MKKSVFCFALLVAAALSVSSCDFIRTVAGRPTSSELQAKRDASFAVQRAAAAEKARQEAEAAAREKRRADLIAAASYFVESHIPMNTKEDRKYQLTETPSRKYYLVLGVFSNPDNAITFAEKVRDAGFGVEILHGTGGLAIGACPSDDLVEFASSVAKIREKSFCPSDCWVLVNG